MLLFFCREIEIQSLDSSLKVKNGISPEIPQESKWF